MHRTPAHASTSGLKAFVLYGNLVVGVIAVAMLWGTYAVLRLEPDVPLLVLAFLGSVAVYQAERGVLPGPEDPLNQPERTAWLRRHRGYVMGMLAVALAGGVAVVPWLRPETWAVGSGLALLSLGYMLPLAAGRRRLKQVWYLKPAAIAGAWAVGGVLLPVVEAGRPLTGAVMLLALARFGFVLPNAVLADWPDRVGDARAGLHTAATRYGEVRLRRLLAGVLAATLLVQCGALYGLRAAAVGYVDLGGTLILLALVGRRRWPASRWFYGFWLDLVIAWPGVTAGLLALR